MWQILPFTGWVSLVLLLESISNSRFLGTGYSWLWISVVVLPPAIYWEEVEGFHGKESDHSLNDLAKWETLKDVTW